MADPTKEPKEPRGQDPDKTTGQERAAEVRQNPEQAGQPGDPDQVQQLPAQPGEQPPEAQQLPADQPTDEQPVVEQQPVPGAVPVDDPDFGPPEPAEEDLPDKPPIDDLPPEDGDPAPTDEEEAAAADAELATPDEGDDTIDAGEAEEPPHEDLPEGTRREDYAKAERDDGEEETPSPRQPEG